MLDYKVEIVSALSPILPTYYEYFRDEADSYPCITYFENTNNEDNRHGKNVFFSDIGFYIKIWCNDINLLTQYAQQVDTALSALGWQRKTYNERVYLNQTYAIMYYEAYCEEHRI